MYLFRQVGLLKPLLPEGASRGPQVYGELLAARLLSVLAARCSVLDLFFVYCVRGDKGRPSGALAQGIHELRILYQGVGVAPARGAYGCNPDPASPASSYTGLSIATVDKILVARLGVHTYTK